MSWTLEIMFYFLMEVKNIKYIEGIFILPLKNQMQQHMRQVGLWGMNIVIVHSLESLSLSFLQEYILYY